MTVKIFAYQGCLIEEKFKRLEKKRKNEMEVEKEENKKTEEGKKGK